MAKTNSNQEVVLITGGSGFIGSALARRLAGNFRVPCFDQEGPPHPPAQAECIPVDLASVPSMKSGFERLRAGYGENIASVVHLAAYYDFSGDPSPKYDEITVRGTERLLGGLQSFHVEQFIFSSTMLVYAPREPGQRINEDWKLEPKWDYPKSKVDAEELIRSHHGKISNIALLRMAGIYNDRCHSIPIANQIQRIYERRLTSRVYPGDTARGQSFLHLDDLVDAFDSLINRRKQLPPEVVLLLGEPETFSYGQLQKELGRLIHGEDWETRHIPKSVAKTGAWFQDKMPLVEEPFIKPWMVDLADDHYALDISRARSLLGWEPKHSLLSTLPKMVESLKADPLKWYKENKLAPPSWLKKEARRPAAASR